MERRLQRRFPSTWERSGSVRGTTGKEKVTFSGDRPTNLDIIESKISMYVYLRYPQLAHTFPFDKFLSSPRFDLHFLSFIYLLLR